MSISSSILGKMLKKGKSKTHINRQEIYEFQNLSTTYECILLAYNKMMYRGMYGGLANCVLLREVLQW